MEQIVGGGRYTYKVHEDWAHIPAHIEMKPAAVAVDPQDRIFCFNRSTEHPIVVFDRNGEYLFSWGASLFRFPHAIRFDEQGNLWLTDGHHMQFMKFTPEGELLQTIGERGHRSDTGVPTDDYSSVAWKKVTHGGQPFNLPTDIAFAPDGSMFMSDGYGNARIHKFSSQAEYLYSWGEPGTAPGQFNLPHGVWIDRRGRLLVADRENDRVQVFDQHGRFLEIWPTELIGPAFFYVDAEDIVYVAEHNGGMVSILTLDGERLARWGDPIHRSCHGIWCDSRRNIYVVQPGVWGRVRRMVQFERV